MRGLIDSIRKLGMVRVAMLAGVTLGIIGAFVWLELQGPGRGRMTMLASDLDAQSAQQIAAQLTRRKIPYRLDGGQIFVPDGDLATARALLAPRAWPAGDHRIRNLRSRQRPGGDRLRPAGEADPRAGGRTRPDDRVGSRDHSCRVHLVLPRREPFAHDRQHAQASVMLTRCRAADAVAEAVQSVVDLVAAGVPGLRPQDVTVVDSNLHLLVQAGDGNDPRARRRWRRRSARRPRPVWRRRSS